MTGDRDPRRDPRPGDVLRKGRRTRRILRVIGWKNFRVVTHTENVLEHDLGLESWRKWAKDAEVVHKAEEPTK